MKFANMKKIYINGKQIGNIGDYIQLLAIDNLYEEMGILEDVVYFQDFFQESDVIEEKFILPINQMIGRSQPWCDELGNFCFPEYIIPVFIGVCFQADIFNFSEYNIEYLKKYAPIGCRDYHSFQQMKKYNIPAYMAGCLTMTLPLRKECDNKCDKVFLVDVPSRVKKYIPDEILKRSEIVHHVCELNEDVLDGRGLKKQAMTQFLQRYQDEASLVITSRLHCAVPCLAMGIPVIITKQYRGYTFDWIENFIKFYEEGDYSKIDWNVKSLSIEEYKILAKTVAIERIKGGDVSENIKVLHKFYMNQYTDEYKMKEMSIDHVISELEKRYTKEDDFEYAIWGISKIANCIYEYISMHYPNAKLVKVIDSFSVKEFHGIYSEKPSVLKKKDMFITIVTTIHCRQSGAEPLFEKLGKDKSEYIYAADSFL